MAERTLFIGLGGTGGKTLEYLYGKMTPEEKMNSHYLFMDTDNKDTSAMRERGIRTVRISNADTVFSIVNTLDSNRATNLCKDWIPFDPNRDMPFLNSSMEGGAAQTRFKSRLCLTRFLRKPNNELKQMLDELNTPGLDQSTLTLRVIIVSSIAGGTGAGTYIQTALYVRKYFRDRQQNISIIGILACPEVFFDVLNNNNGPIAVQKRSLCANAYASIRELNAMNLATNPSAQNAAYGSSINISIGDLGDDGMLFDSRSRIFTLDSKTSPFDSIYFVDKVNGNGAAFIGINQYYQLMADIAYARLYSPLNLAIQSGVVNEDATRSIAPTAIYGSAGYARIVYPYEEVLRYLAERKLFDDIDYKWRSFDNSWKAECRREEDTAAMAGGVWNPEPGLRGKRFIGRLRDELDSANGTSSYKFLEKMVRTGTSSYRSDMFLDILDSAIAPSEYNEQGGTVDGGFSILRNTDVNEAVTKLLMISSESAEGNDAITVLESMANQASIAWGGLVEAIKSAITGQAFRIVSAVFPTTEVGIQEAERNRSGINLKRDLLMDGNDYVHPIAARFLLYSLEKAINDNLASQEKTFGNTSFENQMVSVLRALELAFDDDPNDSRDFTVADMVKALRERRIFTDKNRLERCTQALITYKTKLTAALNQCLASATEVLKQRVFEMLKPLLSELIVQYERFFDSIDNYSRELDRKVQTDLYLHDGNPNQVVFVGASSSEKLHYYANMKAQLERASLETHSVAGEAVFAQMYKRAVADINRRMEEARLGVASRTDDSAYKVDVVFDGITEKYMDNLRKSVPHLRRGVVSALVSEICHSLDIDDPALIRTDPSYKERFETEFKARIDDLRAKASPMIRYNVADREVAFGLRVPMDPDLHVDYLHLGVNKTVAIDLAEYFPNSNAVGSGDDLGAFKTCVQVGNVDVKDAYEDFEIFCFTSVHCLRPNQIYRFNEEAEGSYYKSYSDRIREMIVNGAESLSPHLDKRWHLKGVMPFVSRELEFNWRKKVMSAFIHEILTRRLVFTIDANGRRCFKHTYNGESTFVYTSRGALVLETEMSRLIDYIADNELLIEEASAALYKVIDECIRANANYVDEVRLYKTGMTKDKLLKRLREDALIYRGPSEPKMNADEKRLAAKIAKLNFSGWGSSGADSLTPVQEPLDEDVDEDSEEDDGSVFNFNATLGGILKLAYRLHYTEERLVEDRDYGEALIAVAWDIVDLYARGMHGDNHVTSNTEFHREYVDVLNWGLGKFMESYLKQAMFENRITGSEKEQDAPDDLYGDLRPVDRTVKRSRINVPMKIANSEEYIWIAAHWPTYDKRNAASNTETN